MSGVKKPLHPKGEKSKPQKITESKQVSVDSYAGTLHVEWDSSAAVTPLGQLPFFIEFLKTTKLFDELVDDCPTKFTSNNASEVRDILGSLMLSILSGHKRYSHVTAIRGETVNAELLGMSKVVSEDVVRRWLLAVDEDEGCCWLEKHLRKCFEPLLNIPWVLDLDATIKPLYGKQEGAEVGYNPKKPGRPSHVYHSYFISTIRIALGVDVQSGKKVAGCYSAPPLWKLLDSLPQAQWPAFIRGDISYGTEQIMSEAESRGVNYLFKLKCTPKVKSLIKRHMEHSFRWEYAGHGYEGIDDEIQLQGWSRPRRVVIMRRKVRNKDVGILTTKTIGPQKGQMSFDFAEIDHRKFAYEYSILVSNLEDEIITLAQHYRDRGDSENNFDELKNQWGWGGYTTRDLKRCRITGKYIALIYDWWNIFVRLANPDCHREAITTRPQLLFATGRLITHARQTVLTITSTHAKTKRVMKKLTAISEFFKTLQRDAEQLSPDIILIRIIEVAFRKFFNLQGKAPPNRMLCPA